ncbi:hypothetical protein MNBD_ALPHA12-1073 [hydrothermal vent metagenome]|uniref:ABC3 transporter permease C-terminal domain-containing protein n=1 Tax=hydrothermal vent metagenome TaxID=652676 RepID=A0A3B0TW16_9ZZZZ
MIYWTFKSFFDQPLSLVGSALGIALALILGLFLDAVFRGEAGQILTFIERSPGQVWVLEKGVEDLHMARSIVSQNAIDQIEKLDGVKTAIPMLYRDALTGQKGEETFTYVAGIPADPKMRRTWETATGWKAPNQGGIIIPERMAKSKGLEVGDAISISGASYAIEGFSSGTSSMANSLMFIDARDARDQFNLKTGASFVLVMPAAGIGAKDLANNINQQVSGVNALTRQQLMTNDYTLALDMGGALISMMSMIGSAVAALIVIFTSYAFVSARVGELAVAKALGAPQHQLLFSAMLQTGLVALLGVVLTLIAIGPMQLAFSTWVPDVAVQFSLPAALKLGVATLLIAELAAFIPAIYVQKVDPAMVFNE